MIPTAIVAGLHIGTPIHYIEIFEPPIRPILRSGRLAAVSSFSVVAEGWASFDER
jgi:hypothetical protein